MQIVSNDIHVGPEGVLVEFLGGGGEKVAVTIVVAHPPLSLAPERRWFSAPSSGSAKTLSGGQADSELEWRADNDTLAVAARLQPQEAKGWATARLSASGPCRLVGS